MAKHLVLLGSRPRTKNRAVGAAWDAQIKSIETTNMEAELHELAERLGYVSSIAEVRERVPAATLERLDTSAADLASMARLMAYFRGDVPADYEGMSEAECGSIKLAVGCPKMLTE